MAFSEEAALRSAADRVRARFPDLPADVVDEALRQAREHFADRPVRDFIPILVERAATAAFRDAARPSTPEPRTTATPGRAARELLAT